MERCDYKTDSKWSNPLYRGKSVEPYESIKKLDLTYQIYPDYNDEYFKRYLENLRNKEAAIE
ncbi:hypothetical protein [Anaerococcus nagyae]|uniref:hypothetical protein n=1 Tax=Anaerococcus nagyae TaxID=1755241 RepID=UPI0037357AC4